MLPMHISAQTDQAIIITVIATCVKTAIVVGRGGALVETMSFNRRVVGSTPALAAT